MSYFDMLKAHVKYMIIILTDNTFLCYLTFHLKLIYFKHTKLQLHLFKCELQIFKYMTMWSVSEDTATPAALSNNFS